MNLPLFLPGMAAVILPLFCVFIGVAVYLLKCKFKNTVLRKVIFRFSDQIKRIFEFALKIIKLSNL